MVALPVPLWLGSGSRSKQICRVADSTRWRKFLPPLLRLSEACSFRFSALKKGGRGLIPTCTSVLMRSLLLILAKRIVVSEIPAKGISMTTGMWTGVILPYLLLTLGGRIVHGRFSWKYLNKFEGGNL